jgi:hypothetical protein
LYLNEKKKENTLYRKEWKLSKIDI